MTSMFDAGLSSSSHHHHLLTHGHSPLPTVDPKPHVPLPSLGMWAGPFWLNEGVSEGGKPGTRKWDQPVRHEKQTATKVVVCVFAFFSFLSTTNHPYPQRRRGETTVKRPAHSPPRPQVWTLVPRNPSCVRRETRTGPAAMPRRQHSHHTTTFPLVKRRQRRCGGLDDVANGPTTQRRAQRHGEQPNDAVNSPQRRGEEPNGAVKYPTTMRGTQ